MKTADSEICHGPAHAYGDRLGEGSRGCCFRTHGELPAATLRQEARGLAGLNVWLIMVKEPYNSAHGCEKNESYP